MIYAGGVCSEYKKLKRSIPETHGEWTSVSSTPFFYHFIIEDLARVVVLRESYPNLKVAISSKSEKWKMELFEYFEIPYKSFDCSSKRFEKYVTRSGGEHKNIDGLNILKSWMEKKSSEATSPKKILITRRGLARSDDGLHLELSEMLSAKGFIELQPEMMTVPQQIDSFSGAEVVIGMHGGSLTNLIWCKPKTKVYEIFNHAYRTSDFERLARDLNLDYEVVSGTNIQIEDFFRKEII
jgi:hypothetical protein